MTTTHLVSLPSVTCTLHSQLHPSLLTVSPAPFTVTSTNHSSHSHLHPSLLTQSPAPLTPHTVTSTSHSHLRPSFLPSHSHLHLSSPHTITSTPPSSLLTVTSTPPSSPHTQVDVTDRDVDGKTVLHWAVECGEGSGGRCVQLLAKRQRDLVEAKARPACTCSVESR